MFFSEINFLKGNFGVNMFLKGDFWTDNTPRLEGHIVDSAKYSKIEAWGCKICI